MAILRLCSIPNCGKPHKGHGYCEAHYERYRRYGDPSSGKTPTGEPLAYYQNVVLTHEGNDCLLWPYSKNKNGRGNLWFAGKPQDVHRLVCIAANGEPSDPRLQAAHSCGNKLCVNPHHLSWKTRLENKADELEHGTRCRGERKPVNKLTEAQVREIRSIQGVSMAELGRRFRVSLQNIDAIKRRKKWAWLD